LCPLEPRETMKRDDVANLADPTVQLIEAYTPDVRGIEHDTFQSRTPDAWAEDCAESGGFNPYTKVFTPLRFASADMDMYVALDHITAAAEAGVVDGNGWSTQLFADEDELEGFLGQLEEYDACFRITDRWWSAIAAIVGASGEEGLITCADIVAELRRSIVEGQERREVLVQEAKYFTKQPLKQLRISAEKREELDAHNVRTRQQARTKGAEEDVSLRFRFTLPYLELKKGRLSARQATPADIEAVMAKAIKRK